MHTLWLAAPGQTLFHAKLLISGCNLRSGKVHPWRHIMHNLEFHAFRTKKRKRKGKTQSRRFTTDVRVLRAVAHFDVDAGSRSHGMGLCVFAAVPPPSEL